MGIVLFDYLDIDVSKWRWDWKPSKFQQMRLDKDKGKELCYMPGQFIQYQGGQQQNQLNLLGQLGGLGGAAPGYIYLGQNSDMTPAKFLAAISGRSLHPSDVPGGGKPEWTVAEAGIALAGLEPRYVAAMLYRWTGDVTQIKVLKKELMREALIIRKKERWPLERKGRRYLVSLINIAIMEESKERCHVFAKMMLLDPETTKIQRELIRQNKLLPVMMGVNILEWRVFYSRKYEALHSCLDCWCSISHEHMREKMRNPEDFAQI